MPSLVPAHPPSAATSTVITFPGSAHSAPPLPLLRPTSARPFAPSRREYGLAEVARLTGLSHVTHKVLISTLRKLAEQAHMPLPKTPRVHAGKLCTGALSIGMRSRWDALLFDDWLDDRCPPGGASATPQMAAPPVTASMREDMAARAATLAQLGRNAGRKRA